MNRKGVLALLALVVACVGLFVVPAMARAAAPEVSLEQAAGQVDPTRNDSIVFTLASNEALDAASVTQSDFTFTNGTFDAITEVSPVQFNITVTADSDGAVDIAPSGTFEVTDVDETLSATTAAGADRSVIFDGTSAVVSLQTAPGQDAVTEDPEIEFELVSDEALQGGSVQTTDFSVTNGEVTGVSGTGDTFQVQVEADDQGEVELSPSGSFSVSDLVGNDTTSISGGNAAVTYDEAPVVVLEQAPGQADPTNTSPIVFNLSSNEALEESSIEESDFELTSGEIDQIALGGNGFAISVINADDGAVTISPSGTFSVDDTNGNFSATTAGGTDRTVTYDTTDPTTSIDANPTDPSFDPTPTFGLASSEEGSTFECRLWESNDTPPSFDACLDPYTSAFLPEGDYNFEVRAIDTAGNTGNTAFYVWERQQSDLAAGPEEAVYFTRGDTPVEIKVLAEDDQAGEFSYEFLNSLGGGTVGAWTVDDGANSGTTNYTPGDGFAGEDILNVRVTNNATGGEVETQVHVLIRPVSKLFTGPGVDEPQLTNDPTPTFSYAGVAGPNEGIVPGATFACRIDGAAMSNSACNTGSITTANLSDGPHTFTVRASKPSINPDTTVASVTFTVDTVIPGVPTLDGPEGLTNDNHLFWDYTVPEGVAECRIISAGDPDPDFDECGTSPIEAVFMTDGEYTLEVRTRDDAGNVSAAVTKTVLVDTQVDVTIDSAPADGNLDALPVIEFSSTEDPDVTYECRLYPTNADVEDIPAYADCSSPEQLAFLDRNISYTFDVRVTDEAGNTAVDSATWIQSNTAPVLDEPTVTLEAGTSAPVDLGGSDADSDVLTYEITGEVTGGSLGDIDHDTGLVEFTADEDSAGEYTIGYSVTDDREGGTVTGTATIIVQPDTEQTNETPAETNDTTPTFEFDSPADDVTTFECSLDNGAWEACDSGSYTPASDLSEGAHNFQVRATLGTLADPTPVSIDFIVDLTAPDVTITDQPVELSNVAAPAFTFESTDGTATFECSIDEGDFEPCVSGEPLAPALTDGNHLFVVRSVDPGGNESVIASYEWEVDLTDPEIELGGTPADVTNGPGEGKQTNAKRPIWYFESSDLNLDSDGIRCWIDSGTPLETCLAPFQPATNLADGTHVLHIEADDLAGNVGEFQVSFKVNTLAASVAISDSPDSPSGPNAAFEFSPSTDLGPEGHLECRITLNGGAPGAWAPCESPLNYTNLSSGTRKLEVRAVDSAGNASTGTGIASHTWTTIGGAPDTVISGSNKSGATAAFGFNSPGNPLATFECKVDSGAWAACTSPKTYNNLASGSHTFNVRATNQVGTVDDSPATQTWSATAATAPSTDITRQPAAVTPATEAIFEFSSNDSIATFECRLDGGAWEACQSPKTVSGLSVADHTFDVRAKGSNGLTDSSPATATWTVRAPVVDPPPGETCNPIAPNSVVTGSAKLSKTLRVSATISHSEARPGQAVTVKLNASAKKKKALKKSLKQVTVLSGGKTIATLKGKSWTGSFTVGEAQADDLSLKFVRKKGKAMSKSAAFTVLPACVSN